MKRLSREPLIHFLMLGAILFGAYAYVERKHGGAGQERAAGHAMLTRPWRMA